MSAQSSTIGRGGKTIKVGQGVKGAIRGAGSGRRGEAAAVERGGRSVSSVTTTSKVNLF